MVKRVIEEATERSERKKQGKQGCKPADECEPKSRFTVGSRAGRCPQQRDEAVVIPCLHVTIQKDSCPDGCRRYRPCPTVSESFLNGHQKEWKHTQRIQIDDIDEG